MVYRIKDWSKFQHFKDRKPPWIKLYRDLLDDRQWHNLDPAAAKLLVMLWLLASEHDGALPPLSDIAFRLRVTEEKIKQLVSKLSHWLIQDDITAISERHRGDAPETETEREKDTEIESNPPTPLPDWLPEADWKDFCEMRVRLRKPMTDRARQLTISEIDKLRGQGHDPGAVLQQSIRNSWQGVFALKQQGGKQHARHTDFDKQDYRAGTDGFIVS